jgi:hypothetical protein
VALPTGVGPESDDRHAIRIVRRSDQISRSLWQANDQRFPHALIYVLTPGGSTYRSFRLTDVSISDFGVDNPGRAGAPEPQTDRFTLVFSNITSGAETSADALDR